MKHSVISNANASASTCPDNLQTSGNTVTIPINHEYGSHTTGQRQQQPQFNAQTQHFVPGEPQVANYGSPGSLGRGQQYTNSQGPHEIPGHFQNFDFEPDVGMDMFPRTRLGRMTHDPFGDFGGTTRKRTSLHDPQVHTDGFSRYFDDATDFGFPQFNSLGRRRTNPHNDDDFFNRLPSEFRQYIPESFAHRRAGSGMTESPSSGPTIVHSQQPTQQQHQPHFYNSVPQSPSRKVCDAAIQTEDAAGRSEVDNAMNSEKLYPHGLRNTVDMGIKSPPENENQSPRSSSAPPIEQQQNQQQKAFTQPQHNPSSGPKRPTPPPQHQHQFGTQTSPQTQSGCFRDQLPQFQKYYSTPSQQVHPQQKEQTPPQQTPGGSCIRTIPIFVEGRSEPIINNKEIPNQNASPNVSSGSDISRGFTPPKQQTQSGLSPLNTQQQPTPESGGVLPQTPHTVDTINKIQNIQRDVLDLMSRVEKFTGTRADKEYVYLDEMLTRNLLKLDNIDTNGKDSIRLARKEAIKCIQASINVLEAKAEENKKAAQVNIEEKENRAIRETPSEMSVSPIPIFDGKKSTTSEKNTKESIPTASVELTEESGNKINDPIPLPPPKNEKFNEVKIEDCLEDDVFSASNNEKCTTNSENILKQQLSEEN